VNQPLGLLLFPDKVSMSPAYTLPYHDVTTVNTNITASQLDEYLDAGCEFLPCAGIQGGTAFSDQGTYGYYWSSTSTPPQWWQRVQPLLPQGRPQSREHQLLLQRQLVLRQLQDQLLFSPPRPGTLKL